MTWEKPPKIERDQWWNGLGRGLWGNVRWPRGFRPSMKEAWRPPLCGVVWTQTKPSSSAYTVYISKQAYIEVIWEAMLRKDGL